MQYTIDHALRFLDINITNNNNNKYEFKVHRKKSHYQHNIKPTSCIDPNIIKSVFKGFLHKAHSVSSEKYIKEEEKFLINTLIENDHNKLLKNLVIKYNNKKNNQNNHEYNTEHRDYTGLKKLPQIPNISPKIKRKFKKIGKDIAFTSEKNLRQILCQKNKQNYYQIVNQQYISSITRAMGIYWWVKKEDTYTMHRTSIG